METIAVWFSCGAASAVAAKLTLERYGLTHRVRVLNNPVMEEGEDNRRFLRDMSRWLGIEIERVSHPLYPNASAVEVWDRRGAMVFPKGAPCTVHLKKEARYLWERDNPVDWHVFGFTTEEVMRHKRFVLSERPNVLPVLIDAGLSKQDCLNALASAGIAPPRTLHQGLPERELHRLREGDQSHLLEPRPRG